MSPITNLKGLLRWRMNSTNLLMIAIIYNCLMMEGNNILNVKVPFLIASDEAPESLHSSKSLYTNLRLNALGKPGVIFRKCTAWLLATVLLVQKTEKLTMNLI